MSSQSCQSCENNNDIEKETLLEKCIRHYKFNSKSFTIYTNYFDMEFFKTFLSNNPNTVKREYQNNSISFQDKENITFDTLFSHPISIVRKNIEDSDLKGVSTSRIESFETLSIVFNDNYIILNHPYLHTFFPPVEKDQTLKLKVSRVGEYSITSYKSNMEIIEKMKQTIGTPEDEMYIVDATACIGGDTIGFAKRFKYVVSCEKDTINYNCLLNNINVYKLENVQCLNVDFVKNMEQILTMKILNKCINIVYFDPPWGGEDYHKLEKIDLFLNDQNIIDLMTHIFNTYPFIKWIVIKCPHNLNMEFQTKYKFVLHKLKKINLLVFENN